LNQPRASAGNRQCVRIDERHCRPILCTYIATLRGPNG
jgi:hypothetical protein